MIVRISTRRVPGATRVIEPHQTVGARHANIEHIDVVAIHYPCSRIPASHAKILSGPPPTRSVARSVCERQKTPGRLLANGTRFRRIDDQNRGDHFNLTAADECYFLREYPLGKNYKFGETNNLISNLKKKPSHSGTRGYCYETSAIEQCAREISAGGLRLEWLRIGTLVPVPPSKAHGHPDYADRIAQICRAIRTDPPISIDVRELVVQTKSLDAAHELTGYAQLSMIFSKPTLLTRHLLILHREQLR
jgi:hypothetical protein